jgi:hypothetical protein
MTISRSSPIGLGNSWNIGMTSSRIELAGEFFFTRYRLQTLTPQRARCNAYVLYPDRPMGEAK